MAATTLFLPNADKYGPLDFRNMAVDELPWKATPTKGWR
jgi:hypothetical protein